jgi:hypothetical protein
MSRPLTALASNPNLISGIYNYCDRWCERCPLTSRCLVYASEQQDEVSPQNQDIPNAAFWHKLISIMDETRELIAVWANQAGIDLSQSADDNQTPSKRKRLNVGNHPLSKAGKNYANAASDWFRELEQTSDNEKSDTEAREIIQWYQYQIAVKTIRALSSRNEEEQDDPELADQPKDSDGSAKVALIGIDRSIAAWRLMQLSLHERAEIVVPLILQLARLRNRLEKHFPDARSFVRPGFDETLNCPTEST